MKKLLLIVIMLPLYCQAQNFEFGINGGCNFHFLPINNIYTTQDKAILGYAAGFRANLVLPAAQIGVGVELANFVEYNYVMPVYTAKVFNHIAEPLISPYAFYNRTYSNIINGYLYTGVMAGVTIARVGVNSWQYNNGIYNVPTGYSTVYNSARGFTAGLQAGAVLMVRKHLGLNLEAALRYTDYTYKAPSSTLEDPYHYRLFYIPITLGLRYRI